MRAATRPVRTLSAPLRRRGRPPSSPRRCTPRDQLRCDRAADAMPCAVPLTAEQWRDRCAQQRAAEEAQGVLHRPPGRLPAGHHWDAQRGLVLDEGAAASTSSTPVVQADVPFDDALFAWAVQHAPPRLSAHDDSRAAWDPHGAPKEAYATYGHR